MLCKCIRRSDGVKRLFGWLLAVAVLLALVVLYRLWQPDQNVSFLRAPSDGRTTISAGSEDAAAERRIPAKAASVVKGVPCRNRSNQMMTHLGVVACGSRLTEPLLVLKSAILMGSSPLHIYVFADDTLRSNLQQSLRAWLSFITWRSVSYSLHDIWFPADTYIEWKHLFKLCSSQRLFLPDLLPDVDALLYVDTDVIFLRQLEDIWDMFAGFSPRQIAALAPESEDGAVNWYKRFARHPYFEPLGLNSGLMLMNLTRMRAFHWRSFLTPMLKNYSKVITWGDQDIINIIFNQYPDRVLVLSCDLNFRPDHCMYQPSCLKATSDGVSVLHGNRGYFHNSKEPVFKAIFEEFLKFRLGDDVIKELIVPIERKLAALNHTRCGQMHDAFATRLRRSYEYVLDCRVT